MIFNTISLLSLYIPYILRIKRSKEEVRRAERLMIEATAPINSPQLRKITRDLKDPQITYHFAVSPIPTASHFLQFHVSLHNSPAIGRFTSCIYYSHFPTPSNVLAIFRCARSSTDCPNENRIGE